MIKFFPNRRFIQSEFAWTAVLPKTGYCPDVGPLLIEGELTVEICRVQKLLYVTIFWKTNRLARM